jgi:hypothetical protein
MDCAQYSFHPDISTNKLRNTSTLGFLRVGGARARKCALFALHSPHALLCISWAIGCAPKSRRLVCFPPYDGCPHIGNNHFPRPRLPRLSLGFSHLSQRQGLASVRFFGHLVSPSAGYVACVKYAGLASALRLLLFVNDLRHAAPFVDIRLAMRGKTDSFSRACHSFIADFSLL